MNSQQHSISVKELQKMKGGLILGLVSLSIPVLVMIDVRYLMVGAYVSPAANQIIGAIATILMVLSTFIVSRSVKAVENGDLLKVSKSYNWTIVIGLIAWLLIGVQIVNHSINSVTHFGETFLATLGLMDVYILFGLVALTSVSMRVKKLGASMNHTWGVQSTKLFWNYIIVVWIVMYAVLYLL